MKRRTIVLSEEEKGELEQVRDHDRRAYMRERAAAILKIERGESAHAVACHGLLKGRDPDTIYAWMDRYQQEGLSGLVQRSRRKHKFPP